MRSGILGIGITHIAEMSGVYGMAGRLLYIERQLAGRR